MKESLKAIRVELIPESKSVYKMLDKMRRRHHKEIRHAKVALAWRTALKPDRDGHLILGKCMRTNDLQREFHKYDFIILLNKEVWNDDKFDKKKKYALLDHELCHAAPQINKKGKHRRDERGRYCFRSRDHEIEEFRCIVERHGCYKKDLELFAEALLKRRRKENGK